MEFTVEFYETESGRCPILEFLDGLKETDPNDFAAVMAGLAKLRNRQYHRPPLSKPIGNDLFELRHVGKLNTRVLYFFAKGQRIIAVHGIRNKAKEISKRDRKAALERKEDCFLRNQL
jgi:phage-related protein